jgi:hypothetical protein
MCDKIYINYFVSSFWFKVFEYSVSLSKQSISSSGSSSGYSSNGLKIDFNVYNFFKKYRGWAK